MAPTLKTLWLSPPINVTEVTIYDFWNQVTEIPWNPITTLWERPNNFKENYVEENLDLSSISQAREWVILKVHPLVPPPTITPTKRTVWNRNKSWGLPKLPQICEQNKWLLF